jgi:hypothetical protein
MHSTMLRSAKVTMPYVAGAVYSLRGASEVLGER